MMDAKTKYKVTYSIESHANGVTKEEISKMSSHHGGCDAVVIISIMGTPGNGEPYSTLVISQRGTDGEITDEELFKVWTRLTDRLGRSETLAEGKRSFCKAVMDEIRSIVLAARRRS